MARAAALIASTSSAASSAFPHRNPRLDVEFLLCKKFYGHGSSLSSNASCSPTLLRTRAEPEQAAKAAEPDLPPASAPSPASSQQNQSLLEALDFSAVRSEEDAQLLEDARSATGMGEKMTREQYAALRRKVGGTYRDFFKDSIEVDGEFVDEGWVDKSCRFCKKDTASEPRTVDKFGRYAHVACLEKSSNSGNFFTRLFGM
eukprot:c17659_g1_i1 orf=485-1090(-)